MTSFDIKQYREALKQNYKPSTINRRLVDLSTYFRWCVANSLAAADPVANIRRVSQQRQPKWLSRQEVYKLLRSARQAVQLASVKGLGPGLTLAIRNQAIVVLLLATGLQSLRNCATCSSAM